MQSPTQTPEDVALSRLWRSRFQQEVPVSDHTEMLTDILVEYGVSRDAINLAIEEARQSMDPT